MRRWTPLALMAALERLQAAGPAGAAIADRLQKELDQLNYTKCRFILEEPASLDLLEGRHAQG